MSELINFVRTEEVSHQKWDSLIKQICQQLQKMYLDV